MSDHLFIDRYFSSQGKKIPRNMEAWGDGQHWRSIVTSFVWCNKELADTLGAPQLRKLLRLPIKDRTIRRYRQEADAAFAACHPTLSS